MLLIGEGLIDLQGLHLGHGLRVALALARLSHRLLLHRLLLLRLLLLLLLTHRVDLSLQIRAILVHCRPLIYERASNL